jgi:hypothetical protein
MADDKRPDGLETKDTRGTLIGYTTAEVPHVSRSESELSDKERENSWRSSGTPHAGDFTDEVSAETLGEKSDAESARRVGEGYYPGEAPAAPGRDQTKRKAPLSDQQRTDAKRPAPPAKA